MSETNEVVKHIHLKNIQPFQNHPFEVRDDDAMKDTVQSVKEFGVIMPVIVRQTDEGNYEMISGHRRMRACELAGIDTILLISKYMTAEGYTLSPNTKTPHSLDSFVYNYTNSAGMKDNIKIEINYSLRAHILPTQHITVKSQVFDDEITVNTVSAMEIYASKTVALLSRSAARDLYDMNYMIKYGLFDESEIEVYRKCVVFYLAVATISPILEFDFSIIENITPHKITTDLKPVVRDRDAFDLKTAQKTVIDFLKETIILSEKEKQFLKDFQKGYYHPDLLFDNSKILERIASHPMAIWKTNKNRNPQSI